MSLPDQLNVALKEWHIVTGALANGRQMILLRKGGIYESSGEFELEHRRFILYPTFVHQKLAMLKPEVRGDFQPRAAEPETITLEVAAEVTDIIQLASRDQLRDLDAEHVWTPPLIEMRFAYRPENPLYLLIARAYRLSSAVTVRNTPAYAGCKSWVPLEEAIDARGATPVIADDRFEQRRRHIRETIAAAPA
jgi:hypothetical protein